MKKLLAILLALCMVMSLAACGAEDKDDDKDEKKTEAAESVDKEDKEDKKAPEDEFTPAVELYADILTGDVSDFAKTLPAAMWEALADGNNTTEDDIIDQLASAYSLFGGIFLAADAEIVDVENASDEIADMEEALSKYQADFEIEDAYAIEVKWTYEVAEEYKDQMDASDDADNWYVISVDGEWYVLSESYEWNILDV